MNPNGTPENLRPAWKKGEGSPNPGGRPRRTPFADACRKVAELTVGELRILETDSVPIAIAKRIAKEALKGKISAAAEVANRAEGTPRQVPEIPSDREVQIRVVYDKAPIKNPSALASKPATEG